jgi:hypothetical protein
MAPIVATLATAKSLPDLRIFLKTLQLWNRPVPTVYLYADTAVAATELLYTGEIHVKDALSAYSAFTRPQMERMPGRYGSLWAQFMAEKIALLEWVFAAAPAAAKDGVFFLDADICFFGPLPAVPPGHTVALSPHMIRHTDEARYGTFNGGFLWFKEPQALQRWRAACEGSRFFEQAALEVFAEDADLYCFPIQNNYGWWRLWQAPESPEVRMRAWGIRRGDSGSAGITVEGAPLLSVHTHWADQSLDTQGFNAFVTDLLKKLAAVNHGPAKALLKAIGTAQK